MLNKKIRAEKATRVAEGAMRKATILSNMSHEIVTNEPSLDLQR
jgi:hypothetical protein